MAKDERRVYKIKTINNISKEGLKLLPANFIASPDVEDPDAILVRSADLHDYEFGPNVRFIGRAGAGVNNIPCLLYTSPSPRDVEESRMPSSA